ncbi:MAG: sodium-dependent transporter [Bacteroides sp.]|nr:sodium-dependent transporter [Bacteroides sp.]
MKKNNNNNNSSPKGRTTFGSRIGLIAATVGSAVGLGTIWRFPAMVQRNGGSAFLLIYILCVLLLGIPVMLGEFSLGRAGQSDPVGVFRKLSPKRPWWLVGLLGVVAAYVILSFYMVVTGWTAEYLVQSVTGDLFRPVDGLEAGSSSMFLAKMNSYISSPVSPVIYTFIMLCVSTGILMLGVQKGIERMSNIMMPMLFALMLIFVFVTLQMPGRDAGLEFFLKPDFSKITSRTCIDALGQAFFSLSLGMGTLITYGSYFPKNTPLGKTAISVSSLTLLVAILMGLIIFPAVMTFGLQGESFDGAALVFVTLPEIFSRMPAPGLWAILFFLLLVVAALTSCISIAEVAIVFLHDRFGLKRRNAVLAVMIPMIPLTTICSLSTGALPELRILGQSVFNFLDTFATNYLLPGGALLMCLYLGWFAPKGLLRNQLTNNGTLRAWYTTPIRLLIKYLCPLLIAMLLLVGS